MENNVIQTDFAIKEENVDQLHKYDQPNISSFTNEDVDDIKVKLETVVSEEVDIKQETDDTIFKIEECEASTSNALTRNNLRDKNSVEREMCVIPQIREKPFQCTSCKKIFTTNSNLRVHMRTHTGEKPFECKICGRKFAINVTQEHIRTHTGEKPFECKICEKKFPVIRSLKVHMRIHSGEKLLECKICEKKCTGKQMLQNHIKTHTRECEICGKKFIIQNSLPTNIREQLECNICAKHDGVEQHTSINASDKPEHKIVKTFSLRGNLEYMRTDRAH